MLFVAALVAVALAQTPQKPTLSEIFEAKVSVDFHDGHQHFIGEGKMMIDQPKNKSLESFDFFGKREKFWFLQRFDLGFAYVWEQQKCKQHAIKGAEPAVWGFMKDAKYEGQKKYKKRMFDIWGVKKGVDSVEVGVFADDITRPAFLRTKYPNGERVIEFYTFKTHQINQTEFDVPSYCP